MADPITDPSPARICQLVYLLSAAAVLAIAAAPDTAQRLLAQYGARSSGYHASASASASASSQDRNNRRGKGQDSNDRDRGASSSITNDDSSLLYRLIARLTSVGKVPHSWFSHFYILSLICNVFWVLQFATGGRVLHLIVRKQLAVSTPSMTMSQVALIHFLMGLQAARRLYEQLAVLRPSSSSSMWIVHWLIGMGFYLCTSVAIWVEGSKSIRDVGPHWFGMDFPSLRSIIATSVFLSAWIMQNRCHRYLAGLKKYSLPEEGLFRYLVCPHYTCECVIYLSMAVIAAPNGQLLNQTLTCAVFFVLANLGVTANGTKKWYIEQFGSRVQNKWKMIPFVF